MCCPTCKNTDNLSITCYVQTEAFISKEGDVLNSEETSGCEWDNDSKATCHQCNWEGIVKNLQSAGKRRPTSC